MPLRDHFRPPLTRRTFARTAMLSLAGYSSGAGRSGEALEIDPAGGLRIRGVVMVPENLTLRDWPDRAKRAGLNTIALHHPNSPRKLLDFMRSERGRDFLAHCTDRGLHVEFDFHAMLDLVPRGLFATDPSLFRMDEGGTRTPDRNFCVHSAAAMRAAVENALAFARALRPTTERYYFWSDGCAAWCRCGRCRELSDSDQALLVENAIVKALRSQETGARWPTWRATSPCRPRRGSSPRPGSSSSSRRRDDATMSPIRSSGARTNRTVSGTSSATSRCSPRPRRRRWSTGWTSRCSRTARGRRCHGTGIASGATSRPTGRWGFRQIKSFANDLDAEYVRRNGEPTFLAEYGAALEELLDR